MCDAGGPGEASADRWLLPERCEPGLSMRDLFELIGPLAEALQRDGLAVREPTAFRGVARVEWGDGGMPRRLAMTGDELLDALNRRGVYAAYIKVATIDRGAASRAGL